MAQQVGAAASEVPASASAAPWRPSHNQWAVAMTVTLATFMEVLDTSIANVALPHIAGGLSASVDESTWVLTSYLVANAIVLPISAWIATFMGRKRFYMTCVALFTISSLLCGLAPTLGTLVLLRVMQGAGGGGLQPSEQAILADTFAPEERGMAFAIYGMAVVLAPTIGPTLGGWITDNFDWRWIFFINVPVGIVSLMLTSRIVEDPPYHEQQVKDRAEASSIDYIGVGLICISLGSLQIVLDKGQRDDWFQSHFITALAVIAVLSLAFWIVWELRHKHPVVDLRFFAEPTFATANAMMFMVGIGLYGITMLLPEFLQTLMGYSAEQAGMVLTPGGLAMMVVMPIVGAMVARIDSRWIIAFGFLVETLALLYMTNIYQGIDFNTAVMYRIYTSAGLAFLFIPITTMSYVGVPPEQNSLVSSMNSLSRNIGGAFGISMLTTILARRSQVHQDVLSSHVTGFDSAFRNQVYGLGTHLFHHGVARGESFGAAYGMIYGNVVLNATTQAYIDAIYVMALGCLLMVPLVFVMKKADPAQAPAGMH